MRIIKEGRSSYGYCYIEERGIYFYVHVGTSEYGPFSSLSDALAEYSRYCIQFSVRYDLNKITDHVLSNENCHIRI